MTDQLKAELVMPAYGGDLLVANAGRVSYDRWSDGLNDRDIALIKRFAMECDKSPFYQSQATFRITAPIPVVRQLTRHHVGFSAPNEVSRRYTSKNVEIYRPYFGETDDGLTAMAIYDDAVEAAFNAYNVLLQCGIPREQARFVLPQGALTTILWTGSLYAWWHLVQERTADDVQIETQEVARQIDRAMAIAFPVSWAALRDAL